MIDPLQIACEIARCDREIAEMLAQPPTAPAYLTTMGIEDWRWERRELERMVESIHDEDQKAHDPRD